MEREVGEGIRMGNTCKPMAVSYQCMTKSTTIKRKKKNKLKKKSTWEDVLRLQATNVSFYMRDLSMENFDMGVGTPGTNPPWIWRDNCT